MSRHTIIPDTVVILQQGNKVLLGLRQNTTYMDNYWGLVGGHVEEHETFTQAILREAKEELGIVLEDLRMVHVMQHNRHGEPERIHTFFHATKWSGEIINGEPHKCIKVEWFDLDELPKNFIYYMKDGLVCSQKGILYSEQEY